MSAARGSDGEEENEREREKVEKVERKNEMGIDGLMLGLIFG